MKKAYLFIVGACIAIFITFMLVMAHGGQKSAAPLKVNPAFRQYIQAFTTGMVSARSSVKVRLADNFVDSASMDKPLSADYFEFSPAIDGKTYWRDSRTLEFIPVKQLPQNQVYTVSFKLSKLLRVPDSLSTLVFRFHTLPQDLAVEISNHKAYSQNNLARELMTGILRSSDFADDALVEKTLSATQSGKDLPVTWTHDGRRNAHIFQVDSISRGREAGTVTVRWNGSAVESGSDGETNVDIPALGDFRVISANSHPGEQNCIRVMFSDPLSPTQNLDGLFRAGNFSNLRYLVEDNLLWIYLPDTENKKVALTLEPAIRNINQATLGQKFTAQILADSYKPAVRFTGSGEIMPGSNGMMLPFEAVNLNAVDIKVVRIFTKNILQFLQVNELSDNSQLSRVGRVVLKKTMPLAGVTDYGKWNTYMLDLSTLIRTEPGAIYSVILRFRQDYSTYHCGDTAMSAASPGMVTLEDPETENDQNWDYFNSYEDNDFDDGGWQGYRWEERDNPCRPSYYYNRSVSRNVLASDLGLIAKAGGNGGFHVYVTDLVTMNPLAGVAVEFFNFQLQSIGRVTTDAEGMAVIPLTKRPFLLVATSGTQSGYLKLTDGNALSLSMFDISGEPVQKGIKGYIYGERGVWRPGDSIFVTFILEDKLKQIPLNHPVSMSLLNPSGQQIARLVRTGAVNGFYNFRTATASDAPTGNWLAEVKVGGASFRKTLKIETVKPNRLKIGFDFRTDKLIRDRVPSAMLEASWLTGAKAGNLKAKVMLTLTKSATVFKNFPGYVFDNPTAGFAAENITVFDGRLDAEGRTPITPKIHVTGVAPGALKASFETMVFEEGGDFSVDRFTIPYYPYQSYAGLSVPRGDASDRVLYTDTPYNISLLNVDAMGVPVPANQLKVEVYKLDWRWWWDDSEQGSADFISTAYTRPVDSATIKTSNGRGVYEFRAGYSDWGRYLIKVTDRISGHAAGMVVYADWPGYFRMPGGEKQAAAMLTLTCDKEVYKVGDKVKLTLPSSPDGRALVTIETGSAILKSFWVPTSKGTSEITFTATAGMSPNCYAAVTLIQPHAQVGNDLPIRLYGVIPVIVENPATLLRPVITMQNVLEPGKEVNIRVSESAGKPMTYTLAMVDEGLLDLTRFKTPDPGSVFYAREALGIKTWDLYDHVMGSFSGELQRILSIGGDQEALNKGSLKANRFKPMVKFLGPFELKKGQTGKHAFIMPEYIGSVRVMVVAGQDGAYGRDEKTAAVRKPLMVLATLPRVLSPGETVHLPVSVFAMDKSIKNVKVELVTNDLFTVTNGTARQVSFAGTGDQLVSFNLAVAGSAGIGTVKVKATCGNQTAEHAIEILVRNPNLPVTTVLEKTIPPGSTWTTDFRPPGIPGTNSVVLELSSIPPLNLEKRLSSLIHYPYGCIEQTVSAAFPQLYLAAFVDLKENEKKETAGNITTAIQKLKSFQISSGGLAYWPGARYADDWGTTYAGHFLLEAEQKGYAVPVSLLQAWREFQRQKAVSWASNANWSNNDLAQAYRLYTLALAKTPELGAMNRLLEYKDLSVPAKWQLAAAYQVAGKRETALSLINSISMSVSPYRESAGSYGSDLRDKAIIVDALSALGMKTKAAPLVKEISTKLCSDDWYSTQSTAFALMAIVRFSGNAGGAGILASLRLNAGQADQISTEKSLLTRKLPGNQDKKGVVQVASLGKNLLFGRLILQGIPAMGDTVASSSSLKISVIYKSAGGAVINPSRLTQGTSFFAEVSLTNPGLRGTYQQLALNQVFASGWEIINARNSDLAQSGTVASAFDYQDVRDDRVNTFFELLPAQTKTFRVMLIAAYAGRFYLPATGCAAMYDHTINAHIPGKWVEVVPGSN